MVKTLFTALRQVVAGIFFGFMLFLTGTARVLVLIAALLGAIGYKIDKHHDSRSRQAP